MSPTGSTPLSIPVPDLSSQAGSSTDGLFAGGGAKRAGEAYPVPAQGVGGVTARVFAVLPRALQQERSGTTASITSYSCYLETCPLRQVRNTQLFAKHRRYAPHARPPIHTYLHACIHTDMHTYRQHIHQVYGGAPFFLSPPTWYPLSKYLRMTHSVPQGGGAKWRGREFDQKRTAPNRTTPNGQAGEPWEPITFHSGGKRGRSGGPTNTHRRRAGRPR